MKEYKRITTVMAEPMTMGEAYSNRLIEIIPISKNKKGFIISCNNKKYWIDENTFNSNYRASETIFDKLILEYKELKYKIEKLYPYIEKHNIKMSETESMLLIEK